MTAKPSVADLLVAQAAARFELSHDQSREAWAWDGTDALRIRSAAFGERLARDFYEATGRVVSQANLTTATTTLRGIANWEGPEIPVGLRIAGHEGRVVVDLADDERRVVVIGPEGWVVTRESPVRFYRPAGMVPLPLPARGGTLDGLSELWPVRGDDFVLVVGWLLGCLNPSGSKPLLDISGTQGSGKSVLAWMLRSLVDPNAIPLQTMPVDLRNLAVIAAHHAVPTFDNVSVISGELSDALSRQATGAGFETRKLYTDDDLVPFTGTRSVLLTGIPEVVKLADLVDRTISISLPEIGPGRRLTEAELLGEFERLRPGLIGRLFDGVACALANLPTTVPREDPRMLDFVTWVEAGAPAFGWDRDRFLDAYLLNRRDASVGIVEGSFIGQIIPQLAEVGFAGTATECLARLAAIAGTEGTRHRGWPATARGLRGILQRLKPSLAEASIAVEFVGPTGHDRQRIIQIHRASDPQASDASVLAFASPRPDRSVAQAVDALRAIGVDGTWSPSKVASLALAKGGGRVDVAVEALNAMGLLAPDGLPWTTDKIRGVV
jgi:hypothetical protein